MTVEHSHHSPWRIGVDVGGTFTDGLILNEATGEIAQVKVLSTPDDPSKAFLTAVSRLLAAAAVEGKSVSHVVHGTTVATNAVLQEQLADTVLVTTKGFRDLLEIARQVRPDPYDVFAEKPKRLVPRDLCFEVDERDSGGRFGRRSAGRELGRQAHRDLLAVNPTSIAICLLHAYRNPEHERKVAEALKRAFPGGGRQHLLRARIGVQGISAGMHHDHQCRTDAGGERLSQSDRSRARGDGRCRKPIGHAVEWRYGRFHAKCGASCLPD